jgi:antitoxin component YwqK of YwqJK toxin-antitoxin module
MKKLFFLIILQAVLQNIYSQDFGNTIFQGRIVKIYPYRSVASDNSTDNSTLMIHNNLEIPYYPLTLADGEYIVYYTAVTRYQDEKIRPGDTDNVAISFHVVNGVKSGQAFWYTNSYKKKKVYLEGNYSGNQKDGEWHYKSRESDIVFHYRNGLLHGDVVMKGKRWERKFQLKDGVPDGLYAWHNTKSHDTEEYEMKNGAFHGKYYSVYHKSGMNPSEERSYDKEDRFKKVQTQGQYFDGLAYGEWTYSNDKLKLVAHFDTLSTVNRSSYYYSPNERRTATRRSYSRRYQYYKGMDSVFAVPQHKSMNIYNVLYGYGYFHLYDAHGAQLQADSFYDGSLKPGNILYDFNGNKNGEIRFSSPVGLIPTIEVSGAEEKEIWKTRYAWYKAEYRQVEVFSERKESKDYAVTKFEKPILYYYLQDTVLPEVITLDSSIYTFISKKGESTDIIELNCLHTPTSYKFEKTYRGSNYIELIKSAEFNYDPDAKLLKEVRHYNLASLEVIDTIYIDSRYLHRAKPSFRPSGDYVTHSTDIKSRPDHYILKDTMHCSILWEGKPLSGDVRFHYKHSRKYRSPEAVDRSVNSFISKPSILVTVRNRYTDLPFDIDITGSSDFFEFETYNGMLNGSASLRVGRGWRNYNVAYANCSYAGNYKSGVENVRSNSDYFTGDGSDCSFYRDGQREGLSTSTVSGKVRTIAEYHQGHINGSLYILNSQQQPSVKCQLVNDTLHGLFETFNEANQPKEILHFSKGMLNGSYDQYQYRNIPATVDSEEAKQVIRFCNERKVNTVHMEFDHGYLVNEARFYHCDGIPKAIVKYQREDSIKLLSFMHALDEMKYSLNNKTRSKSSYGYYYDNFPIHYFTTRVKLHNNLLETSGYALNPCFEDMESLGREKYLFDLYSTLPGYYKYFYKSGVQSQEGRVDTSGLKTGWWKFWNENGILMKEIEYKKGFIIDPFVPGGKDTIFYSGTIKGYYPNGKFMMEGYVLDEDFKYECVQDEEIAYQEVFYTKFTDENGNEAFKSYTGAVKDYHINGNKREEGHMLNGKRSGVWKFYQPDGTLSGIGSYKNGAKDGLWITGDLSGIGYVDNQCFDGVIDFSRIRVNMNRLQLEFEEIYYEDGVQVKRVKHNINLGR